MTIGYTTYDVRRDKDLVHLNFGNQAVMVYSPTSRDAEPWLYAYVVAIFHAFVSTAADPEPKRLELLWVRWMERDASQLQGGNSCKYTRISFIPHSDTPGECFGFVDPSHVVRACHLIPAFHLQRTRDLLEVSMARDTKGDWRAFYVNRYGQLCMQVPHLFLISHTHPDSSIMMPLRGHLVLGLVASGYRPHNHRR